MSQEKLSAHVDNNENNDDVLSSQKQESVWGSRLDAALNSVRSFELPDDSNDLSRLKAIGVKNKDFESRVVSDANIPSFQERLKEVCSNAMSKLTSLKESVSRGARQAGVATALTFASFHSDGQTIEKKHDALMGTIAEASASISGMTEDEVSNLLFYLENLPDAQTFSLNSVDSTLDEGQKNFNKNRDEYIKKHDRVQKAIGTLAEYFNAETGDDYTNWQLFKDRLHDIESSTDILKKPSDKFKLALAEVVHSLEIINDTVPTQSENWQQSGIEATRAAQMKILKDSIENQKNLIQTYDSKPAFEEYFKQHTIAQTNKYLQTIPDANTKIKSVIDGFTEDEASYLLFVVDHELKKDAKVDEEIEEGKISFGDDLDESEKNLDNNIADYLKKHPKVERALASLGEYLRFDGDWFSNTLSEIDKTTEKLKRPTERFKLAVDRVAEQHVAFAHAWDDEALTQDKLDDAWASRPSLEYLQLALKNNEEILTSIDKNLNRDSVVSIVENAREEVLGYISSPKYLQKLIDKEGMAREEAEAMQKRRIDAVRVTQYSINPDYMSNSNTNGTSIEFSAYDVASFPKQNAVHEMTHVAMGGERYMTEKEREIYETARIKPEEFSVVRQTPLGNINDLAAGSPFDSDPGRAFMSAAELAPRKFVLEMEMERLGIKKRFDPMSHEHYVRLLELMKIGELKHNAVQILMTTTEKGLLSIMNELAYENTGKNLNSKKEDGIA